MKLHMRYIFDQISLLIVIDQRNVIIYVRSCDLLLYRPTATWNPFVLFDKKKEKVVHGDVIFVSVL